MKKSISTKAKLWMTLLMAVLWAGCESIALMPRASIDAPGAPSIITATVNGIDTNLREVYLRTANNQHYVVNYTNQTRVTDRTREYAVNGLRAGDQVRVDLRQGDDRRLYADRIVLESAGTPETSGIRTVEGTVERILPERGFLELRTLSGDLLTIYVPESSSEATKSHFNRVREGDHVRVEGERLSENRMELLAFL
jgi:translation initiation factor IF-1